jgi:2-octaprenyl-6-methoxyphenol hydroxylase
VACSSQHDILIVGGGPVGAALALALESSGLSVLLADASGVDTRDNDPRTLALSYGSRLILERLGVWGDVTPATPIASIHVSHRGAFGRAALSAAEGGLPALGYVVPYAALQRALIARQQRAANVTLAPRARATQVEADAESVRVEFEDNGSNRAVRARLAVVADGGATSKALTRVNVRDYGQSAIAASVLTSRPHGNIAFERFTSAGPLALLPREEGYALVWTVSPETARELCAVSGKAFLAQLQAAFGGRAGTFTDVSARAHFPLALRVAQPPTAARTVLLGNAAQTLHPVAGQGLNLGLRDAWELGECIQSHPGDPGCSEVLAAYARRRWGDRAGEILLTDALVRVFSNDHFPLRWLRGCGLTFLDSLPPIKRAFMQQMMFGRPF